MGLTSKWKKKKWETKEGEGNEEAGAAREVGMLGH